MLERASTCFETGGRQLLRAPKSCLPTRRNLHSSFWHHGASDVSLPNWWAASSIFDGGSGDVDDPAARTTTSTQSSPSDGALLDFLYPKKTLALIKQLSVPALDTSKPRQRQLHRPPIRRFSTAQWPPPHNESGVDLKALQQAKKEAASMLDGDVAFRVLARFLRKRERGKQELAWQLYNAVPAAHFEHNKGASIKANMLEYLTTRDETTVPSRVLQVFGDLPLASRRPSSYRAAIVAYVSLRMVGPALQLLEKVRPDSHFGYLNSGLDVVLQRTILDEQWDLALRVFSLFLRSKPHISANTSGAATLRGQPIPQIWNVVAALPGLEDHFDSFLVHVREFKHELRSSKEKSEALTLFVIGFVPQVIDQVLRDLRLDDATLAKHIRKLFKDLTALDLAAPACYEHVTIALLERMSKRSSVDLETLCSGLYNRYRQVLLGDQNNIFHRKPSVQLLRNLIFRHCKDDDFVQAQSVVADFRKWYPKRPMAAKVLIYLIYLHADRGDTAGVDELFGELRSNYPEKVDLWIISALLFACARRADVDGTLAQFKRIRDDFGLTPDIVCWNILLLAYSRADDLDGALECFNSCMDSGSSPDKYTFGTLLDLCAERGDVEAFEALFSRAKQMGIPLTDDVRARSGYVQAFLNAGDPEGAEAIAQGMLRSWQTGLLHGHSLTHTWNLLIQHHALERDIAGARQRYKDMIDNNIPLDSWTYGSLMRALVEVKQSNAAYKILTKTMPHNNIRVHALHYAIVMTGLLREGGGQLALAFEAYQKMVEQGVVQTQSSQEASIRTLGTLDMRELQGKNKNARLQMVEEAVRKMLVDAVQGQVALRQPRHSRMLDSGSVSTTPQSHYGLLISLYSARGAYNRCKELIEEAEKAAPDVDNYTVPLTLLTGTMEAHLKAGEHAEVAKCWELARSSAGKFTKTFHQTMKPEVPTPEGDSLVDPIILERFEQSRIAPNRRNFLYKAARLYMRSLFDLNNPNQNALDDAQYTMRNLLINGYTLDVFTWNEFVTTFAQRGRVVDAFSTCEEYLMPGFPGWRNLYPNYIRKDRQGYQWMELRHLDVKKTSIMPRYKTLIVLAVEFRKVRIDERNGVGYIVDAGAWRREILERMAPMTLRAIDTMPRTNDWLQTKYLHNA